MSDSTYTALLGLLERLTQYNWQYVCSRCKSRIYYDVEHTCQDDDAAGVGNPTPPTPDEQPK